MRQTQPQTPLFAQALVRPSTAALGRPSLGRPCGRAPGRHPLTRLGTRVVAAAAVALGVTACTSPAQGFCAAAGECDGEFASIFLGGLDAVGSSDDSVQVCAAQEEGRLRALRANEEEECQKVADTWEQVMACAAKSYADGDECGGLDGPLGNNDCSDEIDDYNKARQDAGTDCEETEE